MTDTTVYPLTHTLIKNGDQASMVAKVREILEQWLDAYAQNTTGKIWIYEENDATPYAQIIDLTERDDLFKGLQPTDSVDFFNQLANVVTQPAATNDTLNLVIIDDFESRQWTEQKSQVLQKLFENGPKSNNYSLFINSSFADLTKAYLPAFKNIIDFN